MLKEMLVINVTTLQHSKCTENINLYNVETFQQRNQIKKTL